jgi:meso-butanediol dehydrogenase/(S,S)-butanediol dehydrogenase/diacetyl reductase
MDGIAGRIAFVTGAGAGIGKATALELARRGADVAFLTRTAQHATAVQGEIRSLGRRCVAAVGDVGQFDDIEAAIGQTLAELGGLDIMVANAGIDVVGTVVDTTIDDWNRIVATNLTGVFFTLKSCVPPMLERGGGAIVIMGSDCSVWGTQNVAAYTATKHALVGLARSMAVDFGPSGIRTNIVCPTFVTTEMMQRMIEEDPAVSELWLSGIPLGRPATPLEVARVVCHLASEDGAFTNGLVYNLDGGATSGMFRPDERADREQAPTGDHRHSEFPQSVRSRGG